jgi:hypothetical protein
MTKKTLSVDEIGKSDNQYESTPTLTREQALEALAHAALRRAKSAFGTNNQNPRLTADDRVAGAVFTVFELLKEGSETTPPFALLPIPESESYRQNHGTASVAIVRPESQHRSHYDLNREDYVMHQWPTGPVELDSSPNDPVTITKAVGTIYDQHRDRLAAAARDLFNYGEEIE